MTFIRALIRFSRWKIKTTQVPPPPINLEMHPLITPSPGNTPNFKVQLDERCMLKDESGQMHSDWSGLVSRRHNHIYLLRFKVLMEPIIFVFIKLMGAAISGHWDQGQALGGSRTKTSHSRQSVMLGCQNGCAQWQLSVQIEGEMSIYISNSTTPIVLLLVSGDGWGIALTLWG